MNERLRESEFVFDVRTNLEITNRWGNITRQTMRKGYKQTGREVKEKERREKEKEMKEQMV